MTNVRAVSLFSNCGAGDVGYRKAGFRFDVMAELDSRRLGVALLNHPEAIGIPGDLRTTWSHVVSRYREVAGEEAPALLCACPPCQGMSSARAGKGSHDDMVAGSKDERNLLVTVIVKVALRLRPKAIVVENVPAFLTRKVKHPKDKRPVSAANYLISRLAKDYYAFPFVGDLADFGIPQTRNRAFVVLLRKNLPGVSAALDKGLAPFPAPTHEGAEQHISLTNALADFGLPALDAAEKASASSEGYGGFHSVPVWDARIYEMVSAIPTEGGKSAWENDWCRQCGEVEVEASTVVCPTCGQPLLRPIVRQPDGKYRLVKGFKSSYRRMNGARPASTITTASGHIGSDNTIHPTENRVLSALECALLQTFPEDFDWGDTLERYGHSNVREMIGEAVPPHFTQLHGKILFEIVNKRTKLLTSLRIDDKRCTKAWDSLAIAAAKDGRRDPRRYYAYAKLKHGNNTRLANTNAADRL